ncbi:MAG: hypothetical protein E7523_10695 [Ruminococcaceae bacterium]|nr:hypothetical protein [Oscillospiraceae bacterium]
MKKKSILFFLLAEFVLLCLFHIGDFIDGEIVFSALCVPFSLPAFLLGKLAELGTVANGFAVMLTAAVCCLPLLYVLKNINKKEQRTEHIALLATSVLAGIVFPLLANPGRLSAILPFYTQDMQNVVQSGLCLTLWSALVCFCILRILRLFSNADKQNLLQYAQKMLLALCILFVACIALNSVGNLITQVKEAQQTADFLIAILHFIANAFPYATDIAVALALRDIVLHYEDDSVLLTQKAKTMSRLCCIALAVTTALGVFVNAVHIVLLQYCSDFTVSLNIPIVSLAFVLGALLFARLIIENRQLREDSDMII